MDNQPDRASRNVKIAALGGVLSALAVASCCLLPFVLPSIGVGGAWIGALTALTPYKPIFITATGILLAYGFYYVYWKSKKSCVGGGTCGARRPSRWVKIGLWIAAIVVVGATVFEYFEPLLLVS